MQGRLHSTRVLVALAALGVSFVLIAIMIAPRSQGESLPPSTPASPGGCADLAREADPAKVAIDSGYDAEKHLVYAHHAGRTYVLEPDDPVCRSFGSVRSVIDHTLDANRENTAVACAVMRDIVANKRTEVRGKRVDQAAAQRFIARRCGGEQP